MVVSGSISSTFYVQLLRPQIPKAQKDTDDLTVFFTLSGSTSVKAACKTLMKSTVDDVGLISNLSPCVLVFHHGFCL